MQKFLDHGYMQRENI